MSYRSTLVLQELGRYRGDSASLSISLTNPDTGAAFTPTGCTLLFTLKRSRDLPDSSAVVQKSSAVGGITVANPSVVSLLPEDTDGLLPRVRYHFGVRAVVNATGETREVAEGSIEFENPTSRDSTLSIDTVTTRPSFVQNQIPFLGSVTGLTGGGSTKLDGQTTAGASAPLIVALSLNDDVQMWKLRAKGVGESEDGTSFVSPDDYHASTNNVIWVRVA